MAAHMSTRSERTHRDHSPSSADAWDEDNMGIETSPAERVVFVSEGDEPFEDSRRYAVKALILFVVLVIIPSACRYGDLRPPERCALILASALVLYMTEVLPLFCTGLFMPVLGTLCAVLGDKRSGAATSTLLVSNIFNNISFMILGALVINSVFMKCGLHTRFMGWLLRNCLIEGPTFLLLLIMGTTILCSVLYAGAALTVIGVLPILKEGVPGRTIHPNAAKRILLACAFAAHTGSTLLPVSSGTNLITVSLLSEWGYQITTESWVAITFPVMFPLMLGVWLALLLIFRIDGPPKPKQEAWERQLAMLPKEQVVIQDVHIFFMIVGIIAVLCITIYASRLENIIGHPACICLAFIVFVFGSGFLSREEFCQLDWDLMALVGGTNVLALMVRETGLGVILADDLVDVGSVEHTPLNVMLTVLVCAAISIASMLSQGITGVLLLPIFLALGIRLHAPVTTAILIAISLPCGCSFIHSSIDTMMTRQCSRELGSRKAVITRRDMALSGGSLGIMAAILISQVGMRVANLYYPLPPGTLWARSLTPQELMPKVAVENLPAGPALLATPAGNVTAGALWQRSIATRVVASGWSANTSAAAAQRPAEHRRTARRRLRAVALGRARGVRRQGQGGGAGEPAAAASSSLSVLGEAEHSPAA